MNVMVYDLMVELLYNIGQVSYVPDEDIEKRLKVAERMYTEDYACREAFDKFLPLAERGCARAMYYVGDYYKYGQAEVVEDEGIALEWWRKGVELGDPFCKVFYSIYANLDYDAGVKMRQEAYEPLKRLAEDDDTFARDILARVVCEDIREKIYWLLKLRT